MVDTHKATLAQATKQLRRLSPGPDLNNIKNSLTKYPLGLSTFKKLLQLKNQMLQVQLSVKCIHVNDKVYTKYSCFYFSSRIRSCRR